MLRENKNELTGYLPDCREFIPIEKKSDKQLLLICATHGNERIGLETVEMLEKKGLSDYFDYIIANRKALDENVRFSDRDLNRSYPGNKNSDMYEERRACEILEIAKEYKYVIDMHEASSGINDFIIIPRDRLCREFPIGLLDLDIVLLWPEPKGPLGQCIENEIELEFGVKHRGKEEVIPLAVDIIEKFISKIYSRDQEQLFSPKKTYLVYDNLKTGDFEGDINDLEDFKEANINGETFYPVLVGQYLKDEGIVCYKMNLFKE